MLVILAVTLAAAAFRTLVTWGHRAVLRQGFQGDASIHFAILRQLHRNPWSRYIEQYVIRCEPMSYPVAFHRACAVIPLELIRRYPFLPSMILFILSAVCFVPYFQHVERLAFGTQSGQALAAALLVFFAMPTNWTFVGPGIAYFTLSARYFARIATGAFFLFATVGSLYGDPVSLILAVLSAAIALLAAMFARQALLFITPLMAVFSLDPMPLAALLCGFVLAFAVSPRDFPLSMRHTFIQWRLYPTLHKKSEVARAALVNYPDWIALWRRRTSLAGFFMRILKAEPFHALIRQPEVVFALVLAGAALWSRNSGLSSLAWAFTAPIAASIIVYLTITNPRLDHLGESYRYLEYALYFIVPALIGLLWNRVEPAAVQAGYVWFGFLVSLTPLIAYWVLVRWDWPERDELQELLNSLDLPQGAVIMPVGLQIAGNVCARRDDLKSFWHQPGLISEEIYRDYIEVWPFLKLDPTEIMLRHGVTHAIADKHLLPYLPGPYRLPGMRRMGESERYIAFERVASPDNPNGIGEILLPEAAGRS